MDSPTLILASISLSLAYLLLRLGQAPAIPLPRRFRSQERLQSPPISIFKKTATGKKSLLLALSFLLGASGAWAWALVYPTALMLIILPALAFALEALGEPRRLRVLPSVLALINQVKLHVAGGDDLPEALGKTVSFLPDGPVKTATARTLLQIEERRAMSQNLANLRGITPFLDEFVSDCIRAGWQHSPALVIALDLLLKRASQYWSRTGAYRVWRDRLQPYLIFARGLVAGGIVMGLALYIRVGAIPLALVAVSILAAILLRFVLASPLARRASLAGALVFLLLSPTFIGPPAQTAPTQPARREAPPAAKSIIPEITLRPESFKLRGSFELPECQVTSGMVAGFVNLRSGPGMHHPVLQVVPEAEVLVYLGQAGSFEDGEWRQVRIGSQTGWIYAPLCKTAADLEEQTGEAGIIPAQTRLSTSQPIAEEQPPESCQIATGYADGWANLRSGPGMGYPVAATLPEATRLRFLEEAGDFYTSGIWFRVIAPNKSQGWIFSGICERSGSDSS